ncbi:GMP synthase [glutamine-hydrolyzing] subunit A [Metallosphaera sp. J1]|uniref:glutamine-hydrolyzing carbamoyl-phosphate synthase small subunit n=1 Tax=Metallosphaera javensis (ex Hofmann et al. 2022) TaxID=99938 RepID=UPI001EDE4284|nr:glutamine-hydrolyzing carbamoyl-phosphate synthase small subunit [Metallosphaera javensis (ex Hofmann et al. 2022)]MCG3108630.1 GMP synthase [glutamine-hydrolyzing] subunit A [Metallosphaera javensis (ex Hofmann et al. 2022)]
MTYCKRGTEGLIYLEDGTLLRGCGFGAKGVRYGEVVFTTAMNGYPESMTDPSYRGQILIITHPLVGNYGVPDPIVRNGILQNFESEKIQIEGLVVTEETDPSKWNSSKSLHQWMAEQGVPGVSSVDTRLLVKKVRTLGSMMGVIASGEQVEDPRKHIELRYDEIDFTRFTSPKSPIIHQNNSPDIIVLVDCGIKHGILEELYKTGFTIVRVPCKSSADEIMNYSPKGVVFGNGPGNPNILKDLVKNFSAVMEYKLPTLGICLGHQVATLALGGNVRKMKFGHRAINKPVMDVSNNKCYISTHNHGYGVYKEDIPPDTQIWFVNPDDGVVEGLIHKKFPLITTQFHPEARPGPNDTTWVFQKFKKMVIKDEGN